MIQSFICKLLNQPRQLLGVIALGGAAVLAYALYMQHGLGLIPCPMCIVQRYALTLVVLFAVIGCIFTSRGWQMGAMTLALLSSLFGAFVAARQSFLQWFPPEIMTCGRDFYGMIEQFPLQRFLPMIFAGSGDCVHVDWSFLGLSIANYSFIAFAGMALAMVLALWMRFKSKA